MTWTSLDDVLGAAGPCGLCGGPDQRHRVCDSIAEQLRAGEDPATLLEDFGISTLDELLVLAAWGAGGWPE